MFFSTTNLSSGLDFSFDLAPAFEESTALSFLPLDMERSALLGSGVNHPSNDPDDDKQASFISELDSWTGLTSSSLDDKVQLGSSVNRLFLAASLDACYCSLDQDLK